MNRPELLSPAGDYKCFLAALNAGADAVYLGLQRFSARAGAGNLSADELKSALELAHINDKKIYLTVNTLLKDGEIDELYDMLYEPYMAGLDAVIVQDAGVISYIRKHFPDLPVHVSTQAAVTGVDGALFFKNAGAKRIVPARELSINEITRIGKSSGLELECFIHGSLCYSYSGKCLLSSFIGGRSGNRGRCAQPCRLPYDGKYPLSLKDLCTIDLIPELCDAGISSFKIEGRMKNSSYVYGVTSIYRKYIDLYADGGTYAVDPDDRARLISYYTRSGNCKGYYHVHNDRSMITPDSPAYATSQEEADIRDITCIPERSVNMKCTIRRDCPVSVEVFDNDHHINVVTDIIPEPSRNQSLTREGAAKQLLRSGNTGFKICDIDLILDDGLFLANGALNSVRRRGLDDFKQKLLSDRVRNGVPKVLEDMPQQYPKDPGTDETQTHPLIKVSVTRKDQLDAAVLTDADVVIIPFALFESVTSHERFDPEGKRIYIRLPYVIRDEGRSNSPANIKKLISRWSKEYDIDGYYVSDHESLNILKEYGRDKEIIGDIHLYVFNRAAHELYRNSGVTNTTVPVELNERELSKRGITSEELIVYGKYPVMISANCVYNTKYGCKPSKGGHDISLTDRKGQKLFVHCDCSSCTNVIYNSATLCITDEAALIKRLRPKALRFDFTDESPRQLSDIMSKYHENASGAVLIPEYTRGHIKRGVD